MLISDSQKKILTLLSDGEFHSGAELAEAFPGEIQSISVSKPTMEDVFIHRTGHRFWTESRERQE